MDSLRCLQLFSLQLHTATSASWVTKVLQGMGVAGIPRNPWKSRGIKGNVGIETNVAEARSDRKISRGYRAIAAPFAVSMLLTDC